ncbi:NB-ARC domain-containing protein [Mastigocladopsis repens]|uniref:NB-ARC domain-containing protein n=1 Tax=Mastigocladopsis repens TaxID=221287 RepID=UPI000307924F|nr:NB-ARC domain-containing protein [Mastigocladopsis repens]
MSSNSPSQSKRNRGVILTPVGWRKLEKAEKRSGQRFTKEQLCDRTGLSIQTISRIRKRKVAVDQDSLECYVKAFGLEKLSDEDYTHVRQENQRQDWGDAPNVSVFYDRCEEMAQLQQWVLEENCRLVALLGMGGIGKTALAVKFGQKFKTEFEVVVWRSLQNPPTLEELLGSVLQSIMQMLQEDPVVPTSLDGKLSKLMEYFRDKRCLLILDNAETILSVGGEAGHCMEGYEGYGQLFQRIGEVSHQSCLLVTSREKPKDIVALEGEEKKVRTTCRRACASLQLRGLKPEDGRKLFEPRGQFTGTDAEWIRLIKYYGGNPFALKMVAAGIQQLFDGSIAEVLEYIGQGVLVFNDIRDLLDRQFSRLSPVEQEVMLWLAINREPVSVKELKQDVVSVTSKQELPDALYSLLRRCLIETAPRSLIEKAGKQFSLQPVVKEYVTERLVKQVCKEIVSSRERAESSSPVALLQTHALMKATAKDCIRETQRQLIVQPLLEQLLIELGSQQKLVQMLKDVLEQQRH